MIAPLLAALSRPLPPPSRALRSVFRVGDARLAVLLCSAFRDAGDAHVAALHHRAVEAAHALARLEPPTDADLAERRAVAIRVQAAVRDLGGVDRTAVLVAVVRELLADAPACCVALDRAVRDAARHHAHAVAAEHEALAADVIAREVRL